MLLASVFANLVAAQSTESNAASTKFSYSIGALSGDYLGRTSKFGHTKFNGLTVTASGSSGNLDYSFSLATQTEEPSDDVPYFDLSFRFLDDDWKLGLSKEPRNWSPSDYSSLIWSENAEPIPGAYVRKANPTRSDSPFLSWLGKYRGEFFIGRTNDSANGDFAIFVGNQLVFEPVENLEVELVRTIQLGGPGRDTSSGVIWKALIGDTNEGTARGANQMAGVGLSYTFSNLRNPVRVYGQIVGEDEAGWLPTCNIDLKGIESQRSLFGVPTRITIENVDTRTSFTTNGFCGPRFAYNNSSYQYINNGRVIGSTIDSESNAISIYVEHEFTNWSLSWMVGQQDINMIAWEPHRLSSANEDGLLASINTEIPLGKLVVDAVVAYQDFDLDSADLSQGYYFGINLSGQF